MYLFNYPIETELQIQFWSSVHRCNIMKAYAAFSLDEENFIDLTMKAGYTRAWRNRAWAAYGVYVNTPDMLTVPFSELEDNWWIDMPNIEVPSTLFVPLVPIPIPVYIAPIPNPVLTLLPISVEQSEGTTATLIADATGYDSVEWFEGNVTKGITTTLNVPVLNDNIVHSYKVVFSVSDAEYNTTRSTSASASVVGTSGIPVITEHPLGGNGDEITGVLLTSIGTGQDAIQWQKQNTYLHWVDIVGEVAPTYNAIEAYTGKILYYRAVYTNVFGVANSGFAQVYLAKV
jgi:hypothetical protein